MPTRKAVVLGVVVLLVVPPGLAVLQEELTASESGIIGATASGMLTGNWNDSSTFMAYAPVGTTAYTTVTGFLLGIGAAWSVTGSMIHFSVPRSLESSIVSELQQLQNSTGLQYFEENNTVVSTPYLEYTPASGYNVVAYAFGPSQIASAYNFTYDLRHGLTGSGYTIGIVDAYGDPSLNYDVVAYDHIYGLPPLNLNIDYPEGIPGVYNSTWSLETATDVEWAHAMAPGASIILYVTPSALTDDLQFAVSLMVDSRSVNIISLSWGNPESQLMKPEIAHYSQIYQKASAYNISVFAATGDYGASSPSSISTTLTVNFPASEPHVTAIGGTSLYVFDGAFHQAAWGGTYEGQTFGSGGGYSDFFSRPYWQSAPSFASNSRGVPDVSMDADPYTGMAVISSGSEFQVGGTSVATPIWADIGAIMDQASGRALGNVNPILYQISRTSAYNTSFQQITQGTNGYYGAAEGWNAVTGLGTPKVSDLVNASAQIERGFGGYISLFGNSTYSNSTSALLNVTVGLAGLTGNGSNYYYIGYSSMINDSVQFGVNISSGDSNYLLRITEAGKSLSFVAPVSLSAINGNVTVRDLRLELKYTGQSVIAEANGSLVFNIPVFLSFVGASYPVLGGENSGSPQNSTDLGAFNFSAIQMFEGASLVKYSSVRYDRYAWLLSSAYSTLGATLRNGTFLFSQKNGTGQRYLVRATDSTPHVLYELTYSSPVEGTFSLDNYSGAVSWTVNSTAINGNTSLFTYGGQYNVTALISPASGGILNISRIVYVPQVVRSNITIKSSVGIERSPRTSVEINYLEEYNISGRSPVILLSGENHLYFSSTGFYGTAMYAPSSGSVSVTLNARPVNVSLFVFAGRANVTISGQKLQGSAGNYTTGIAPGNITINVSAPGFTGQAFNIKVYPGTNYSGQVMLSPEQNSSNKIYGTVKDLLYSFPIPNANISISTSEFAFTNSTGYYVVYTGNSKANVTASATMYVTQSEHIFLLPETQLNLLLKPANINTSFFKTMRITSYFPLLFFLSLISWSGYKGSDFAGYYLYVSQNGAFLNPQIFQFNSSAMTSTLLTGVYPGHVYYATVVLKLTNGEIIQSGVVKITYSNPLFLLANLAITGSIAAYLIYTTLYLKKKWRRNKAFS